MIGDGIPIEFFDSLSELRKEPLSFFISGKNRNNINGWIILDKPTGISSAQAVNKVKKLLKPQKIGHAGTLDPLASGVLPLALGEATKTIAYMMDKEKTYSFTAAWGEKRDTDDSEGKTIAVSDKRPAREDIEALLPQFTGNILQTPPAYSALKVKGERAYDLARAGETVELQPRNICISTLTITDYAADKTSFICHCSKGTYIRSIARDMGDKLGCYGHISALRRLKVGKFTENGAISLDSLEELLHKGALSLLPVESALDDIPALEIEPDQAARLKRGQSFPVKLVSEENVLARCDGKPIALCSVSQGQMKPVRVFNL